MHTQRKPRGLSSLGGFSLIELLIVVAIIGIIAAIAIPALLQARIAANESAAMADAKALYASNATYAASNSGAYATSLQCLGDPSNAGGGACPGLGWPAGTQPFVDAELGCMVAVVCVAPPNVVRKKGYQRTYTPGVPVAGIHDPGTGTFTLIADPVAPGQTGNRFFTIDHTALTCQQTTVSFGPGGGLSNPPGCIPI